MVRPERLPGAFAPPPSGVALRAINFAAGEVVEVPGFWVAIMAVIL